MRTSRPSDVRCASSSNAPLGALSSAKSSIVTRGVVVMLGHRENVVIHQQQIIVDYQVAPPAARRGLGAEVIADG